VQEEVTDQREYLNTGSPDITKPYADMTVDCRKHGIPNPKAWDRPHCRVYNANSSAGSFYYQPMLEYIDRKSYMGDNLASMATKKLIVMNRIPVELPNAHEVTQCGTDVVSFGPLRLGSFLNTYTAKQIGQRNQKTVHVKNELVRQSKSTDTLVDKRTSTIIRDQYINQLSSMYTEGIGRLPAIPEVSY